MRAMLFDAPAPIESRPLVLRNVPKPAPAAGHLLVRTSVCGVCHTDQRRCGPADCVMNYR